MIDEELLAHYKRTEKQDFKQLLEDHCKNVALYAFELGKDIELSHMCGLIGLLHDAGKGHPLFQSYLRNEHNKTVVHSSTGGRIIEKLYKDIKDKSDIKKALDLESVWKSYKDELIYPILAHHGLFDILDLEGNYIIAKRLNKFNQEQIIDCELEEKIYRYINIWCKDIFKISLEDLFIKAFEEYKYIKEKINILAEKSAENRDKKVESQHKAFYDGCLVRTLLAILKEADIYDSVNYDLELPEKIYSKENTCEVFFRQQNTLESFYLKLRNSGEPSEINKIRSQLSDEAYNIAITHSFGNYKLAMPVGSGKTFAALRYALHQAVKKEKKRIFYTTAFLSVLEQNASEIKSIIGEDDVLEHHSNFNFDNEKYGDTNFEIEAHIDEYEYNKQMYLRESWESPLILTTLAQLSNTLFKDCSSSIRRFSKLINSIIIIDEIQSIPVKMVELYNLMMNFLGNIMKCTIIHCTATLPSLDNKLILDSPCLYNLTTHMKDGFLVDSKINKRNVFRRVNYYSLLGEDCNQILQTDEVVSHLNRILLEEKSVLFVLNTKSAVLELYNMLKKYSENSRIDCDIYYLTTNLCAAHRLERIEEIKEKLVKIRNGENRKPIICVSTKLIEAGVDIDFDVVYRSITSLSSIIQSAGRANRNGKKKGRGKVFLFAYGSEQLERLPEFKIERSATKLTLKNGYALNSKRKIDITDLLPQYFECLYSSAKNDKEALNFQIKIGDRVESIVNLLSRNKNLVVAYNRQQGIFERKNLSKTPFILRQSFKTAARYFEFIENNQLQVIVPFKNEELLEMLHESIESEDYIRQKNILRRLQRYTISISKDLLRGTSKIKPYQEDEGILCLSSEDYNEEIGLFHGEFNTLVF